MKQIKIPRRPGHALDADADDCLAYVSWAGIQGTGNYLPIKPPLLRHAGKHEWYARL
jgi:hypothetical protein